MMVCGGLAGLVPLADSRKTFRSLSAASVGGEDFPLKWVGVGVAITSVALIVVQKVSLGLDVWMTVVAILLSLPLMLVGLRVLGETNWGPISAMSNMMQGIFGILAPGHIPANMLASGTTGTIAVESEALMQDYKAGDTDRLVTEMSDDQRFLHADLARQRPSRGCIRSCATPTGSWRARGLTRRSRAVGRFH
jgi:hypothetical protein